MSLEQRKRAELDAKCAAFEAELDQWCGAAHKLPQHTSQIARLNGLFRPLGRAMKKRVHDATPEDLVGRGYELSAEVLVLFRAWAFYRQKLEQRFVPWQREFLEVADDLTYRWWKPADEAAQSAAKSQRLVKAPPLVFLNGEVSPFTITRKVGFSVEVAEGLDPDTLEWSRKLLRRSPVPVVGVPYFASRHIPDLMVIAHEVGHNVEDDFAITKDLETALDGALVSISAPDMRREGWRAWLGEIFADIWGVLSGGAAFVDALIDLVADRRAAIEGESQARGAWGAYPTVAIRLRLLLATLEALGLQEAARERRAVLDALFRHHAMAAFDADIGGVVDALLGCKPASLGCTVCAASPFDLADQRRVKALSEKLADGYEAGEQNTALLAQAIGLAFGTRPDAIADPARTDALWDELRSTVTNGVRASHSPSLPAGTLEAQDAEVAAEMLADLGRRGPDADRTPDGEGEL